MGRNLFATDQQQPQAGAPAQAPRKGRNLFAPPPGEADFEQKVAGMSHEQIVDEYRNAKINSPYYNFLVKKIEAPQAGETPEQAELRAGGQKPAGAPSPTMSAIGGFAADRTYGWADELGAGIDWMRGEDYDQSLAKHRRLRDTLEEENPGSYLGGQLAGTGVEIAATLGASAPLTWYGRLGTNVGLGMLQGGINGLGSGDTMDERLSEGATQAGIGLGVGLGLGAAEGIYKGGRALLKNGARRVQRVTNPTVAAEKDLADRMVADRRAQMKQEERALRRGKPAPQRRFLTGDDVIAAEGLGQRTMVSDLGGDITRERLKAAGNVSADAMTDMRGAAAARQVDQGQRVTETVSDAFGDLNPKAVRDDLNLRYKQETDEAYALAEANPNSQHLWSPALQRALSTSWGRQALKSAITKSKNKALRNGEEIIEPIFEEGPDGLMQFSGKLRLPDGRVVDDIQGIGMSLRFWDSVKRSMDDDIDELMRAGRKDDASDLISVKNEILSYVDNAVPEYGAARATARDFFGQADAHDAGAEYFKNMGAFDIAEARAALERMKPAERELFARGYAAELVTQISKMGNAEDVNKLFKSPQARMRMRDALGDDVANQLEAFTHREMVQGLLGKHLGANSTTWQQALAAEGLKATAMSGGTAYMTGDPWALIYGSIAGAAVRGGFRYSQRAVLDRYARAMAELATSDDPDTIARILSKVSKDSGYMDFSRSVSSGMAPPAGGAVGGAAGRIEPRMPFADGGPVRMANAGLVKKAAQAAGKLLGKAEKPPKRIVDLGMRAEVDPVMINGKDVREWSPADWGAFGRAHGREDVGPLSDEEFAASLVELPTLSGRTFTVPGGIDDVEKPFTYYDLLHLKSQAVDPNDLDPDVHRRLHNRMVRSMQPGPEFDDVDRYNQLAFGMISPNQPLTPNELAMARVRAKSPEDIKAMADMAPWQLGDTPSKEERQALSRGIARHFGLQSKKAGGIGASGSADYSRIADMAKLHSEKPEFYRFKGAGEGGADDAENWSNFVGRVAAQTPGLSYKTASLGTVWQDPANAAISAIDRHMAGSFRGAMFEKPADVNKFNRRVLQKFNKGRPRGQGARSFDEMLEMPGGRGVLVDELFVELNRRGKTKLRSAKTGELNPKAPDWARNADWIREPEKVDRMAEAYVRALRENDRIARENNQGLFANQWMIWDRLRQRLEPHEIMHPSIRHLPRMSLDQIKAADKAHSKAGYKAESGVARPSRASELAYFSVAPLGGLAALAAYQDEQGQ